MTTAIVTRITPTGINYIVHVRPAAQTVVFYGWNDAVIKSVTPMPDGVYILDGQHEDRDFLGQSMPTVAEIVTAFEEMAVEIDSPTSHLGVKDAEMRFPNQMEVGRMDTPLIIAHVGMKPK